MYNLVLAKGGSKLKALPPVAAAPTDAAKDGAKPPSRRMFTTKSGELQGQGIPIKTLANILSGIISHTVVDKTGLTGDYDIHLKWTPEGAGSTTADSGADPGVSIFTAVQEQLGLKLQPTKGPTETLVIQHAELPSQN